MIFREPVVRQFEDGNHPLETNLHVYGGRYSIDELRQAMIDHGEYYPGLILIPPRFSRDYGWEDEAKYLEKYGDDVVVARHGPYQARTVGIPMVLAQRELGTNTVYHLTPTEEQVFVAHDVQHDDEEGELGDIPYMLKTIDNKLRSFDTFCKIQRDVFGERPARNHIDIVKRFDNPRAKKPDTFKRRFWDANERLGYFGTALLSWHLAQNDEELLTEERRQAQQLALVVGTRHGEELQQQRGIMPFVDFVLKQAAGEYREIKRAAGVF